jgi:hypothetical protein
VEAAVTDEGYTLGGKPISEERLRAHYAEREDRWGSHRYHPIGTAWEAGNRAGYIDRDGDELTLPEFGLVDELAAHLKFLDWKGEAPEHAAENVFKDVFTSYLDGYDFTRTTAFPRPEGWVQDRKSVEAQLWAVYRSQYMNKNFRPEGEKSPRIPEPPQPKGMWAWAQNIQSLFKSSPMPSQLWSRALRPAEQLPAARRLDERPKPPEVRLTTAQQRELAHAVNEFLPPGRADRTTPSTSAATRPPVDHTAKAKKKPPSP